MLLDQIILAAKSSDDDSWVKLIFFVIVAILWGIGQIAAKLGKKSNKPKQPFTPTFQPPQVAKPPPMPAQQVPGVTTRRVSAGGTTITTRVVQTAQPVRTVAKVPPQRPKVVVKAPKRPPKLPKPQQQPKAARQPTPPRTPPPIPAVAPSRAIPASQGVGQLAAGLVSRPRPAASTAGAPPVSLLTATMRPGSLRTQLIVTELLRPPIALRDPATGPAGLA